jgi:glyoxylate carboligase
MARKVADVIWEMLAAAGVKRCYGIVGDALNPVIDALRRNGKIEFIHACGGNLTHAVELDISKEQFAIRPKGYCIRAVKLSRKSRL